MPTTIHAMPAHTVSPHRCVYCGNNPIPHWLSWLNESFLVAFAPVDRLFSGSLLHRLLDRVWEALSVPFTRLLRLVRIISYDSDPLHVKTFRAKALWEEALRRGIPMKRILILGRDIDTYEAHVNGKALVFAGLPRPLPEKGSGLWWMDDKEEMRARFDKLGIPVPRGGSFTRFGPLVQMFRQLEKPVIIKPRQGSRGRHTTTFIYTEDQLAHAFKVAKQICHWVVMEEHLVGSVWRGTVIGGKLVGILGGDPPKVTGDGVHVIRALIELKNKSKPEGVRDVQINEATEEFLARNGLTLQSVLPQGFTIDLTEKIGVSYGGSSFEMTDETHPEIKRVMEEAGRAVNDPLLGFDFIIPDVTKSPKGQRWGIIECNSLPFINLHHYPLIGTPKNVAKYVWDLWEKPAQTR